MGRLTKAVRGITGHQATIIGLRQEQQQQLPVDRTTSGTRPSISAMFGLKSLGQGLIQQGIRPEFLWVAPSAV